MSVVGIDFGNANNVVALARRKGIDVVLNTESKRETPSMVNFGAKQVRLSAPPSRDRARSRATTRRVASRAFQSSRLLAACRLPRPSSRSRGPTARPTPRPRRPVARVSRRVRAPPSLSATRGALARSRARHRLGARVRARASPAAKRIAIVRFSRRETTRARQLFSFRGPTNLSSRPPPSGKASDPSPLAPASPRVPSSQRFIGCAAADKINMQPKNTIVQLKRLIGLKFSDPEVQAIVPSFLFPVAAGPNDEIIITVNYQGEKKTFTPERLVAVILSDLKSIAEADHGAKVTDAVVSVPVFFTDAQRRAMLDACHISGLNTMRLMHETTATALAYGIFKTAEFGDDPHNVVFVDVGHSALQVCVVRFTKSQLKVLATGFDRNLGGNAFDQAMFDHFCEEFKATKKIDVKTNARASLRLRIAIEKMKKILSANPEAPLSIECLMDEVDVGPA